MRHRVPDRAAVERVLTENEIEVVHELARALGVDVERWHRVPTIARPFTLLAWRRLADALAESRPRLIAEQLAAGQLSVRTAAMRSATQRGRAKTRGQAA